MAAPVRSRRFFGPSRPTSAAAPTLLYTVPSGRTAIIHWLSVSNPSGASRTSTLLLNYPGTGSSSLYTLVPTHTLVDGALWMLPDELALNPGDTLWAWPSAANSVLYTATGSLLDGEPE